MAQFVLTSTEFKEGDHLPVSYQADQDNMSPALQWDNPPSDTARFALAMHDPDAPTGGSGWWHWFVDNLPADLRSLPRNAGAMGNVNLPDGAIQFLNDGGDRAYGGCYPPVGDPPHRYIFTIYALSADCPQINLGSSTALAGFIVNQYTIAKASITVYYSR